MNVIEDAFQLAAEVLRKYPSYKTISCNIAFEKGENVTSDDFIYSLPETPHYLIERGIITVLDWSPIGLRKNLSGNLKNIPPLYKSGSYVDLEKPREKGLIKVSFDLVRLREWFNRELGSKLNKEGRIVKFPEGRDYLYENGVLYIKLQDGSACPLDLSNAEILRPVFESFFYLFKNTNKKLFTRDQLLSKYKELTKQDIDWETFIKRKSSITGKMINKKECLRERIVWGYSKKDDKYSFEILTLSDV